MKRAVLSVLNQSYANFVVRIFDNASGDGTEDVARELMAMDSRISYHRRPENIGSLNNIIRGMETVTTPYFTILCDDDALMPGFFENALDAHERSDVHLAFVSTRVVVVDEQGSFAAPWSHPRERQRFAPPAGVMRCLKAGVSLPGVVYRTSVIKSIGPPRTAWWNWTESGWNALAALRFPIEFCADVGAIVFVHQDSGSKRMDFVEFRVSWFRMLSEVHGAAVQDSVASGRWWTTHVLPLAYVRFLGTVMRLCNAEGSRMYDTLGRLAVTCGLSPMSVSGVIKAARAARALGIGAMLNDAFDWGLKIDRRLLRPSTAPNGSRQDPGMAAASRVFFDLNRQAGLT